MIWASVKDVIMDIHSYLRRYKTTQYWTENQIKKTKLKLLRWKSLLRGNI